MSKIFFGQTSGAGSSPPDQPLARRAIQASIVAAWSIVTVAPLWAAVLLQPVPVDAPPPSHEARTPAMQAQVVETWTPPPHESQRRRTLPQEGIAAPAAFIPTSTAQRIIPLHYTQPGVQPVWKNVLIQPVPVDAPPPSHPSRTAQQPTSQWSVQTWETQRRVSLSQAETVVVFVPFVDTAQFPISQWPPLSWDVQKVRTLPQGSAAPASVVPFARTSQQPIRQWEHPSWDTQRRGRLTVSVDPPIPLHAAKALDQGPVWQWPPSDWPAQSATRLSQSSLSSVPVPVSSAAALQRILQSHYAPPAIQPIWASVLLHPVPVDAPPPSHPARTSAVQSQRAESWVTAGYELPSRRLVPQVGVAVPDTVPAVTASQFPISQWPPLSWDVQKVRTLSQEGVAPASMVPFTRTNQQPITQWDVPSWETPRRGRLTVSVDPPMPLHAAKALAQAPIAHWLQPDWPAQSATRFPQSFVPAASVPFVETAHQPISQWSAHTWEAQRRPVLPQGVVPADAPPPRVSSALLPMRHWGEPTWEVPARRVLVQPAPAAVVLTLRTNQLPIALTPALTWETQRRPSLILLTDPVPFTRAAAQPIAVSDGPTWGTQTRPRLIVSVDPPPVVSRRPTLQLIVWQWEALTWPAHERGQRLVESAAPGSISYIRVTGLSGSLASCADVVGTMPTATQVTGTMPTGVEVSGTLATIAGVTGTLPTAENITGVL